MKTSITNKHHQALTLVEVIIVTILIGLATILVLPAFAHHGGCKSTRINCASNLKQVALACRIWEGDNNDRYPAQVYTNALGAPQFPNVFQLFQVMSNELNNPKILTCPADLKRTAATNFTGDLNDTHVSYFMGLNTDETNSQSFLSGDYNLDNGRPLKKNHTMNLTTNQTVKWTHEVHLDCGNVALADGSVQQLSTPALQAAVQQTGLATNRLMFPQ